MKPTPIKRFKLTGGLDSERKSTAGLWHEAKKESISIWLAQLLCKLSAWLAQYAFLLGACFSNLFLSTQSETMRNAVIFCRLLQKITE
jgi:hypothetical protein